MPRLVKPPREKIPTVFIVVEGKCSENKYFNNFNIRNFPVTVKVSDNKSAPGIVKTAKSLIFKNVWDVDFKCGDRVWCVFDRDNNTEVQLRKAHENAEKSKFQIAFSNPCFELWLLWHLTEISPYFDDCEAMEKAMVKPFICHSLGTYDKSVDYYCSLKPLQKKPLIGRKFNMKTERRKGITCLAENATQVQASISL